MPPSAWMNASAGPLSAAAAARSLIAAPAASRLTQGSQSNQSRRRTKLFAHQASSLAAACERVQTSAMVRLDNFGLPLWQTSSSHLPLYLGRARSMISLQWDLGVDRVSGVLPYLPDLSTATVMVQDVAFVCAFAWFVLPPRHSKKG